MRNCECGAEVADNAVSCPHCGRVNELNLYKIRKEQQDQEAYEQHEKVLTEARKVLGICADCKGSGVCWECRGKGSKEVKVDTPFSSNPVQWLMDQVFDAKRKELRTCKRCEGRGECYACEGSGYPDPAKREVWQLIKRGRAHRVTKKQVTELRDIKRDGTLVDGREMEWEVGDLLACATADATEYQYKYVGDRHEGYVRGYRAAYLTVRLERSLVASGITIHSLKHEFNEFDKLCKVSGVLRVEGAVLSSGDLLAGVELHAGDAVLTPCDIALPPSGSSGSQRFEITFRPMQRRETIRFTVWSATEVPSHQAGEWYARRKTKTLGPFPPNHLKKMVAEGKLKPDDELCRAGTEAWVRASELVWLFPPKPIPRAKPVPPKPSEDRPAES